MSRMYQIQVRSGVGKNKTTRITTSSPTILAEYLEGYISYDLSVGRKFSMSGLYYSKVALFSKSETIGSFYLGSVQDPEEAFRHFIYLKVF